MSTSTIPLPIIDLQKARDAVHRLDVAKQVVKALETSGFLFLDKVEGFDSHKLLNDAKWFFGLSEKDKLQVSRKRWNPASQNHYRGYFPLQPDEISYKEGYEIGQDSPVDVTGGGVIHPFFMEANLWPDKTSGAEEFHKHMVEYYSAALQCGTEILRLVSLGSGLQEDWFESMFFPGTLSTLRLLHYPPRPKRIADSNTSILCCSEHSDSGFITLLATFHYEGLQILCEDGRWVDVPPRPDSLVMNIGDMLAAMSGGRFKATQHRVVDIARDRFSVPFFFEPNYNAEVSSVMPCFQGESPGQHGNEQGRGLRRYGPWLIEKMRSFSEYREILDHFDTSFADGI